MSEGHRMCVGDLSKRDDGRREGSVQKLDSKLRVLQLASDIKDLIMT
jgi:hypothetical protein